MDFAEFDGKVFTLDAADYATTQYVSPYGYSKGQANSLLFRLDGVVYEAIEDDEDDYRSSLGELRQPGDVPMVNVFTPTHVKCEHITSRGGHDVESEQFTWYMPRRDCDILRFTATGNGKTVLEVGTDNTEDYYPSCVLSFFPQDLPANAGVSQ
jgi:hypothetical protein